MKTLVITGKQQFKIEEIALPVPNADQALIEIVGNTMCNQHDVNVFTGGFSTEYPLEAGFPGHEGVGRVVECGAKLVGFAPGDLVVMTGIGGMPLYSQFVTRDQGTFFKVTPTEDYDVSALASLELYGCVEHALNRASMLEGKKVGIAGLGAGGLAAIQLLKRRNPESITGIDIKSDRLQNALANGADKIVDASEYSRFTAQCQDTLGAWVNKQPRPKITEIPDREYDVIIECSGNSYSTLTSFALAREEVVMFGYCKELLFTHQALWFTSELTIRNSMQLTNADLKTVADLFSAGQINPAALVTHRSTFEQYAAAVAAVQTGDVMKCVLTFE